MGLGHLEKFNCLPHTRCYSYYYILRSIVSSGWGCWCSVAQLNLLQTTGKSMVHLKSFNPKWTKHLRGAYIELNPYLSRQLTSWEWFSLQDSRAGTPKWNRTMACLYYLWPKCMCSCVAKFIFPCQSCANLSIGSLGLTVLPCLCGLIVFPCTPGLITPPCSPGLTISPCSPVLITSFCSPGLITHPCSSRLITLLCPLDWCCFLVYLSWPHLTALPFSLPWWASFMQLWWHQEETSLLCHFWHYVVIKNGILVNSSQTAAQITVSRKTVENKTHPWWAGDMVGWKQKRQVQSVMWHMIKTETICFSNIGWKHVQG